MSEIIRYTAEFIDDIDTLKKKYPPVHINEFYHHCTTGRKLEHGLESLNIGEQNILYIYGRLTSEKVDTLLVLGSKSNNLYPHITLSTAQGIKPVESNTEIIHGLNNNTIIHVNDIVKVTQGYLNGDREKITSI